VPACAGGGDTGGAGEAAVARAALAGCGGPAACGISRPRRGSAAASRTGVHPGVERGRGGPVAGERRASADGVAQHPMAQATLDMDATLIEKRTSGRRCTATSTSRPISRSTLVGGAGPDRAFGFLRRQRACSARAIARSRRGVAPAAGGGDQALSVLGYGRLSAGSSQVLRRGQERALRG
jgi:hypothetical protein